MNLDADGRGDGACNADVADVEADRLLLEVGAAKYFHRTTKIEKRDAWREDDDNWNLTFD